MWNEFAPPCEGALFSGGCARLGIHGSQVGALQHILSARIFLEIIE
jgi:hypothetical protein